MKQTVYVDVLLAVNFFMNYFLLLSSARILRTALSRTRICLAAIFGAAAALSIFLPRMALLPGILYKLAVSAGMVLIAFPWRNGRIFVRTLLTVCAVTFGFGGTMFALWLTFAPHGMVYRNGVIYFHISPLFLIGVTVGCYTVITLAGKFTLKLERLSKVYDATVTEVGRSVKLRLLCDTGNCLTEPFSGSPVIVVRRGAIASVLPSRFNDFTRGGSAAAGEKPCDFRMIPFSTVGGDGVMAAFRPQRLEIADGGRCVTPDCYVAVSDGLEGEECDGLMPPDLLD